MLRGLTTRPGKKPPKRRNKEEDLPKPTKKMQARETSLELDKNLGKTMVVSGGLQRGPGAPGYYCDLCDRTLKDSVAYLDHLNSRQREPFSVWPILYSYRLQDLRKLGQNTKIHRSTLDQVRLRIAQLREQTKERTNAKAYDFEQRLKEIKDVEKSEKQAKKEKKRQLKESEMKVDQPQQSAEVRGTCSMCRRLILLLVVLAGASHGRNDGLFRLWHL
jgi:U4/U6.U5 tri-snRNP component SNU23